MTIDMGSVEDIPLPHLMEERAQADPSFVYCTYQGEDLTFGSLNDAANRIANGLLAFGLKPGDRVAVMVPSHPDHLAIIFGLWKAGLVRVPVNIHAKGRALQHFFDAFEPAALIADETYRPQLEAVPTQLSSDKIFWRNGAAGSGLDFHVLLSHPDSTYPKGKTLPETIVNLTPSSGTTGEPKGIMKTDRNLRAGAMIYIRLSSLTSGSRVLVWEPLHHGAGVLILIAAILEKVTIVLVEHFSASRFWQQICENSVTHFHYLGSVLPILLKQPPTDFEKQHQVRYAWGGGCPAEIWETVESRFGIAVREGYGLAELVSLITINVDGKFGSCGKPVPYYELMLIDETGVEVGVGEVGEIAARPLVPELGFIGYFRNEEAGNAQKRGDWFCTGDLARRDEDGYYYFVGRRKESLRRRGINISAWEVETIINEHDAVIESSLIGVPSSVGEDDLKLFVRLVPGRSLEPLELIKWCEPRMPYFQIPRYIEFIEEFQKTPTLRIQKKYLSRSTESAWDLESSGYIINRNRI